MQCELCGNDCGDRCRQAEIEGVRMMLCPSCMRHGHGVQEVRDTTVQVQRSLIRRSRRIGHKDVYEGMNRELVNDWGDIIKKARENKGLTREQLGFKIGERTVTISKIENGELRPSDKVAQKLEKELSISLFEEVKAISTTSSTQSGSQGYTLGDFIKFKE
ncbi:MAG: multiprotein bridging factor aMBF1 [Candidatus Thermoplasmatota archaeon]|nr:multiprotein bridging factor aMBF1 [Candidatus Thermoplasmatota archaeon]